MEIVKNLLYQDYQIHPKEETGKNLFFSRPPHPPKIETVKNLLFHYHHIPQI